MEKSRFVFKPANNPIEELYYFSSPIGKMKDPKETIKFIEWLQPLTKHEHAYYAMILVRAKEKRELIGFRGKEKSFVKIIVPGYVRNPKLRLFLGLRRLALLAQHSYDLFIYERHEPGTNKVVEIWRYPHEIVGILVDVNIHNWIRSTILAYKEFLEGMWEYVTGNDLAKLTRPDERIKGLLPTTGAKGTKKYFTLDIDDQSIAKEIIEEVKEYTGFVPARITTPRGMHLLISWEDIVREKREEFRLKFVKEDKLRERYGDLVEYKKIPQEPCPGIEYKKQGFIVRFYPEEK